MFIKEDFKKYNRNPDKEKIGDCATRALSLAYDVDYNDVYKDLGSKVDILVQGVVSYTLSSGYEKVITYEKFGEKPTVKDFCKLNNDGTYILLVGKDNGAISHAVCCINGDWYDTWNSGTRFVYIAFLIKTSSNELHENKNGYKTTHCNILSPTEPTIKNMIEVCKGNYIK